MRGNRAKEILDHISELYTKEEVIAMLAELQLEIEEMPNIYLDNFDSPMYGWLYSGRENAKKEIQDLIQQKINSLKEKEHDAIKM